MADDFRYHIDHHASLVRPADLSDVDAAVEGALLLQRRLALLGLSDGEFRRRNDLAVVYDAVEGFGPAGASSPVAELVGAAHAVEVRPLVGTPSASGRLAGAESGYLGTHTERSTMLALPAPGFVAALGEDEKAGLVLAEILHAEIEAVAADGVVYVLLRNPALGFLLTVDGRERARGLGIDPDATMAGMLEADGAAIAGLNLPEHFCLGLDLTTAGAAAGEWDRAAVGDFLARQTFTRIAVDHPEAAPFPLELMPQGLVVSLGIIDISTPVIEEVEALVARIDAAAEIKDIDDLAISTNGGFHAVPSATADTQRAKLELVEMSARYFWGNEL